MESASQNPDTLSQENGNEPNNWDSTEDPIFNEPIVSVNIFADVGESYEITHFTDGHQQNNISHITPFSVGGEVIESKEEIQILVVSQMFQSKVGGLTERHLERCSNNKCINRRILNHYILSKRVTNRSKVMLQDNHRKELGFLRPDCLKEFNNFLCDCERLVWPVVITNQAGAHIISVMAMRALGYVYVVDSARGTNSSTKEEIGKLIATMIKQLWSLGGELGVVLVDCHKQICGSSDCGIFQASFIYDFLWTGDLTAFPTFRIPNVEAIRAEMRQMVEMYLKSHR